MRRETMLKIARLLRTELDRSFTIRELSKKLAIGYRPAYNHVSDMTKEGILLVRKAGASKQCSLNLENPRCRQLLADVDLSRKEDLFREYHKLKSILENLVETLSGTFEGDLHSIVLFGSYTKGTAVRTSDIDMLFIVADLKDRSVREGIERACAGYEYSHTATVSPLITDIAEFRAMIGAKGINAGKEARAYGLPLYGSELFWRLMA